jgi:hypothetical protein
VQSKTLASVIALAGLITFGGCGGGGDQPTEGGSSAGGQPSITSLPAVRRQARQAQEQLEKQHRSESPGGAKPRGGSGGESGTPPSAPPVSHHDSGGGSEQFRVKSGDNTVQEFGQEAGAAERARAAAALHGYLDSRAARDWSSACSFLSLSTLAVIEQIPKLAHKQGKVSGCPAVLGGLTGGAPTAALKASAIADVGALRVRGNSAYLLFHGPHHYDYLMPMVKERGSWKVGGVEAVPVV